MGDAILKSSGIKGTERIMTRSEIAHEMALHKIVAVIRLHSASRMAGIVDAIIEGGVRTIEITLDTPQALDWIAHFASAFRGNGAYTAQNCLIGAGTVLNEEDARAALAAGAQFLVSPVLFTDMIPISHAAEACAIPGGATPTELLRAWNAGADAVKIFPAPGPDFIKAVRAPLPNIPLYPTGGVTVENAESYLRAGAVLIGAGTSLVNQRRADAREFDEIKRRAGIFTAAARAVGQGFFP